MESQVFSLRIKREAQDKMLTFESFLVQVPVSLCYAQTLIVSSLITSCFHVGTQRHQCLVSSLTMMYSTYRVLPVKVPEAPDLEPLKDNLRSRPLLERR